MGSRSSVARRYHNETKYSEEKLQEDRHELDWSTQPSSVKDYASEERIFLGRFLPIQPNIFTSKESLYEDVPSDDWDSMLGKLSRLLYLTNGITAYVQAMDEKHALRAAPSAGALYPTELYVALRDFGEVKDGIYNYQINTHSLALHWEGDFWKELDKASYGHEALKHAQVVVLYSGMWYRSSWRYQNRGYRRSLLDTGHVLGNMVAYAPEEDLTVFSIGGFYDDLLNSLLMFNEEDEGILLMAALPQEDQVKRRRIRKMSVYPDGQQSTQGATATELHSSSKMEREADTQNKQLPALNQLHDLHLDKPAVLLPGGSVTTFSKPLQEIILRRRSTRSFSGNPMTKDQIGKMLGYAYYPVRMLLHTKNASMTAGGLFDASLLSTYVIVQAVEDVQPGVYYFDPREHALRLVRAGDQREKVWHACLGQELGRDAAAVVVHTCDLDIAVQRYGERAYRYMHMDAGHIGQRLNLSAVDFEAGASGIGGFFDDEMNGILGLSLNHVIVYITTLGIPQ